MRKPQRKPSKGFKSLEAKESQEKEKQRRLAESAFAQIKDSGVPEFQFMFVLAGIVRGSAPGLRRTDKRVPGLFAESAHHLATLITEAELGRGYLNWSDPDAVDLEFRKAWASRVLPSDSGVFELAITLSEENLLGLPEGMNRWVVRIANIAFCLSELLPEAFVLIPVNDETASKLGISLRTLSLAIQELIKEKLVTVIRKADQSLPVRRARRLKFNAKHELVSSDIDGARKRLRKQLSLFC